MKVFLLNGAKYSGKDTLADKLMEHLDNTHSMMFKTPLYKRAMVKYGLSYDELMTFVNGPIKEIPCDTFGGLSPRQALINISEIDIKGTQGELGVAVESMHELLDVEEFGRKTFVYRDGGFDYEANFFRRALPKFGLTKLIIVRILRDGCNFDGDSRSYIDNPDITIYNNVDESPDMLGENMLRQFKEQLSKL